MLEISKEFRFEAAHSLPHLPVTHKCHHVHGHSYKVRVICRGPINPDTAFVIDYADISAAMSGLIAELDHKNINDVLAAFGPTSAENLCQWFYIKLKAHLPLDAVEVYETPTTCARYCPREL